MAQAAAPLALTPEQRRILEAWRDAPQTPRQVAFRARLILLASAGVSSRGVARALRTTLVTVLFWRRRFHESGLTAVTATAPGRGPRRRITARKVRQIVQATLHTRPPEGQRWTIQSLARAQGVKIGRASCREKSVDLGGRRIIKKKKKRKRAERKS